VESCSNDATVTSIMTRQPRLSEISRLMNTVVCAGFVGLTQLYLIAFFLHFPSGKRLKVSGDGLFTRTTPSQGVSQKNVTSFLPVNGELFLLFLFFFCLLYSPWVC
jgi:hypothetical protein